MNIYIIIPAHNEEKHILKTLNSLVGQSYLPKKIVVVNDSSTDNTAQIAETFKAKYAFIEVLNKTSEDKHLPGSKVIEAFNYGLRALDSNYDIICKFDADLIFPENYLESIKNEFIKNSKLGLCGGFCYISKKKGWVLESLTGKDHVRGGLKAYKKQCFKDIGGLKSAMGWDTIDELLSAYHHWEIKTLPALEVKHLKPTGHVYNKSAKYKQGEAFYRMRYGFFITLIAALKLAYKKKKVILFNDYMAGYFKAKKNKLSYLVSEKEGVFIRALRWRKMREKLLNIEH